MSKPLVIAATGHRPKYCPCKYKENHPWLDDLKNRLYADLDVGYNSGQIDFLITGMAIGFDTWIAEVALELDIPIHAYIPFTGQESQWPTSSKEKYRDIISKSAKVVTLNKEYHPRAFTERDKAMVDNADMVMALLNPMAEEGGTFYTVKYAMSKKLKVENYWKD